jgi:peptidoglycan/xylan/chitin deacetylase (PgdA/CDA1 family)
LKPALKNHVRRALYRAGIARLLARHRTRGALTVVMFHRVLPVADPRSASADPDYTMALGVFESFLDFLRRTYRPVSLKMLEDAAAGGPALPPRALLITFDDGWNDTACHAAPALAARAMPATVFVTSGALECDWMLWRDAAAIAARAGLLSPPDGFASCEAWLETLPASRRDGILQSALESAPSLCPLMMDKTELAALARSMSVGAHGVTHTPLTQAAQPRAEFEDGKAALEAVTGQAVSSFAFPHGRYDPPLLAQGFAAGYRFLFTSDSILNKLTAGRPASPVLGRIAVSQSDITDAKGCFCPARASFFLSRRRVAALDRARGRFA